MPNEYKNFNRLKRRIYLWVLPFLITAMTSNSIIEFQSRNESFLDLTLGPILTSWFIVSYIIVLIRRGFQFIEYSTLVVVVLAHLANFYFALDRLLIDQNLGLGELTNWTGLLMVYIFITLKRNKGLILALSYLVTALTLALLKLDALSYNTMDTLIQYFSATTTYIVTIYFGQYILKVYSDLDNVKKEAYVDSLTGIGNRYQINHWFEHQLNQAVNSANQFCVIFFDLDNFKDVNDHYGHKVGDEVLKEVVQLVKSSLRSDECFGRWGGEEFIVIINAQKEDALKLADRLRKRIETHEFETIGQLTSSFGVSNYQQGDSIDSILGRADKALYQAKNLGRNKVQHHCDLLEHRTLEEKVMHN